MEAPLAALGRGLWVARRRGRKVWENRCAQGFTRCACLCPAHRPPCFGKLCVGVLKTVSQPILWSCCRRNRPSPVGRYNRNNQACVCQRVCHLHHQRLCQVRCVPAQGTSGPCMEGSALPLPVATLMPPPAHPRLEPRCPPHRSPAGTTRSAREAMAWLAGRSCLGGNEALHRAFRNVLILSPLFSGFGCRTVLGRLRP